MPASSCWRTTPQGEEHADEEIVAALGISLRTVARVRKRLVTEGFQAALDHRPQPARPDKIKIKGDVEQKLVELACSDPPEGRCHWTLQLLADETGRPGPGRRDQHRDGAAGAEKNDIQPWIVETWCIPPEADAEYVWRMEDVIQTYLLPYDPSVPGGLLRRGVQATVRRGAAARAGRAGPARPGGLRVRAQGGLPPVADVRAAAGLASCPGDRAADPAGLRPRACGSWWTCITPRPRRSGWCRTT